MNQKKETEWLCQNAQSLEQFAGQWVVFSVHEGLVSRGEKLQSVLSAAKKRHLHKTPFVFHVPSRNELGCPHPLIKPSR
jgi:hypothetical protein